METIEQTTERLMNEEIKKLLMRNRSEIVKRVHKKLKQLKRDQQREQKKLS